MCLLSGRRNPLLFSLSIVSQFHFSPFVQSRPIEMTSLATDPVRARRRVCLLILRHVGDLYYGAHKQRRVCLCPLARWLFVKREKEFPKRKTTTIITRVIWDIGKRKKLRKKKACEKKPKKKRRNVSLAGVLENREWSSLVKCNLLHLLSVRWLKTRWKGFESKTNREIPDEWKMKFTLAAADFCFIFLSRFL